MKGSSRKHREPHSRARRDEGEDKYRNALKERPYREASDLDRKEQRRRDKSRPERKEERSRTEPHSKEESYEELSRKKRKIESELQALDMEEAAERRKAEEKKSTERSRKKAAPVRIKEEPLSDDDSKQRHKVVKQSNGGDRRAKMQPPSDNGERPWGGSQATTAAPEKPKEKPNFAVSGKLAEDTNTYNGVVIKYNEPAEARKPHRRWRLYPFKGDSEMPFIPIHRQSAYLFGRTRSIADIPIDHPSCSKQHAVLQFRLVPYRRDDGTKGRRVRPYIIDLESSNGTFVNNRKIDARCYVELMEKDVVKFGFSTREYVVLHEESRNEEEDDDIQDSN